MTVVVALGDSLTCGEGVGVRVPPDATWVALLAHALPGRLTRLAAPGARVADVRYRQLPQAPTSDLATLLVGLNDAARAGFEPKQLRSDLLWTVRQLASTAREVILGRLHDPARLLPLPHKLAEVVRERVQVLNAVVDEAAQAPRVHVLDLTRIAALQQPGGWSTDRIHPSRIGHRAMAAAAARCLEPSYPGIAARLPEPIVPAGPGAAARVWWATRHGLPYVARHVSEFAPPMLAALAERV